MVVKWPTGQPANQPSSQSAKYTKISQVRSKIQPTSTKLGPKIHQVGSQNPPKSVLEGLLERSWAHLGPKMATRAKMLQNVKIGYAFWVPSWRPKSMKSRSKSVSKFDIFFEHFLDRFLERFGANLGPTWLSKPSQNAAKLASNAIQKAIKQNHKNLQKPLFFTCKSRVRGFQVGAKIDQKSIQEGTKNKMKF